MPVAVVLMVLWLGGHGIVELVGANALHIGDVVSISIGGSAISTPLIPLLEDVTIPTGLYVSC